VIAPALILNAMPEINNGFFAVIILHFKLDEILIPPIFIQIRKTHNRKTKKFPFLQKV
jgi:hypothetical protein